MSLKFSMKRGARAWYFWSYSSRLGHVLAGSRIRAGTPSHSVGTSNPKTGSVRKWHVGEFAGEGGVQKRAGVPDADALAEAERAAGPAGIDQPADAPYFSSRAFSISA